MITEEQARLIREYAPTMNSRDIAEKVGCLDKTVRKWCRNNNICWKGMVCELGDAKPIIGFSRYYITSDNKVLTPLADGGYRVLKGSKSIYTLIPDDSKRGVTFTLVKIRYATDRNFDPREISDKGFIVQSDGTLMERSEFFASSNQRHMLHKQKASESRTKEEQIRLLEEGISIQQEVLELIKNGTKGDFVNYCERFWKPTAQYLRKRDCPDKQMGRDCFDSAVMTAAIDLFDGKEALFISTYTIPTFTRRKYLEARVHKKKVARVTECMSRKLGIH